MKQHLFSKSLAVPIIATIVLLYFIYHMFQGNRGLLAYLDYMEKIHDKEQILINIESEQKLLENKVHMISPITVDLDFLDELARGKLGLIGPNELCILNYKAEEQIR